MLEEIKSALAFLEAEGYEYRYGPVAQMLDCWNLLVVRRKEFAASGPDFTECYEVTLTHEGYVPEQDPYRMIAAVHEATKMGYSSIEWDIAQIGETSKLVESATVLFRRLAKGHAVLGLK